jgi:uncharacterized protein (TIGR03435 family)
MEELMNFQVTYRSSLGRTVLLTAIVITVTVAASMQAGVSQALPQRQQAALPNSTETRLAFEVASIRPSAKVPVRPGARGGGGARPDGCANGLIEVDPRRFVMTGVSLQALVAFAYPEWAQPWGGCSGVASTKLLSGGADWIRSEQWDIQAVIPEGVSTAITFQYLNRQAPQIDEMLRTLLSDRFKLVLRREPKDIPVYFLTVANGGPRFNDLPPDNGRSRNFSLDDNGNVIEVKRGEIKGRIAATRSGGVTAYKVTMSDWAKQLNWSGGRPVLDRTGLTGEYSFHFDFVDSAGINLPPVFNRQEEIGLKLEDGRAVVEVWTIEHAEKPSNN